MANHPPSDLPHKDLWGPWANKEKGVIEAVKDLNDQSLRALAKYDSEYSWVFSLARKMGVPEVSSRVGNSGVDYFIIATNGKRGTRFRKKEWQLEGWLYSRGNYLRLGSFNDRADREKVIVQHAIVPTLCAFAIEEREFRDANRRRGRGGSFGRQR